MSKRGASGKLIAMYIVFILMTIAGITSLVSGIALWLYSGDGRYGPQGQRGRLYDNNATAVSEAIVLGFEKSSWKDVHIYSSLICTTLVVLHVLLNWRWIVNVTKRFF